MGFAWGYFTPISGVNLDSFVVFFFNGLCHGKSSSNHHLRENMFGSLFPSSSKLTHKSKVSISSEKRRFVVKLMVLVIVMVS